VVVEAGVPVVVGPSVVAPPVTPWPGGVTKVESEKVASSRGKGWLSVLARVKPLIVIRRPSTATATFLASTNLSRPEMKSATWKNLPVNLSV
jgi:hypothetical protein